ncbi:MAG TPA: aminoacetone oxidase family FAD-binding enzyme [Candidatus Coproplasma avistercoris]|nr:aminoacetone oxidase family FAD-binding enzyme [Candidatus Coproplasma avistercoris]
MHSDVAIIGGGASGLAAAALLCRTTKLDIALIEGGGRLGKKLAASGNGQGNISNAHISAQNYHGSGAARAYDIISCFGKVYERLFYGRFTCDERGRIYPAGRQASALSDCLIAEVRRGGVNVFTGARVVSLEKGGQFVLRLSDGSSMTAKYVVMCVGGKAQKQFGTDGSSYALARAFGHRITPLFPSLVQLKTDVAHIKTLRGIRADCNLRAVAEDGGEMSARGDVIFTDYGVSGNAVFSVSPVFAGSRGKICIGFAPGISEEELAADIRLKQSLGYERSEVLALTLNNQIGRAIVRRAGSGDAAVIAHTAKNFTLEVNGTLGFDYAQVTRGGVDMSDVNDDLESALCPGLFFAGEVLDVDGDCGGYNLTWAFASAARVAEAIAGRQI